MSGNFTMAKKKKKFKLSKVIFLALGIILGILTAGLYFYKGYSLLVLALWLGSIVGSGIYFFKTKRKKKKKKLYDIDDIIVILALLIFFHTYISFIYLRHPCSNKYRRDRGNDRRKAIVPAIST